MRLALAVVSLCLASGSLAAAEPSSSALSDHASALRGRLRGDGLTVRVEPPFVVVGDGSPAEVRRIATGFLRDKIHMLEQDFFAKRPDKLLEIWLFHDERAYRRGAKKYFGDEPDTPYGYYSPTANALVMNADGLGTLSHELVHPYIEANFPDCPAWFNEGLASLFEYPSEREGHLIGLVNWRLPELQRELRARTLPDLGKLLHTTSDEFYNATWDAYAQARYLVYYLQEHGKLHAFYTRFVADHRDASGQAALEAVLGEPLARFEPAWRRWVAALVYRR